MIQRSIRVIFGAIDNAIFTVVEYIFQLILDLANVEIFADSVIDEFSRRIYLLLGLVMLFKIMISFIQILINPDKMSDKEQGVGNILKRVVISLALIFLVPSIFDLARKVQVEVIPVIPKVILGTTIDQDKTEANEETINKVGQMMAFYSFIPFFTYDNESCIDGSILGDGTNQPEKVTIWSVATATNDDNLNRTHDCSNDKNKFVYKYSYLITTAVGVYLVYVLVSVAVAVAIRTIKLGICEFVAPIPIASYVDPKQSKQTFDKWVSTTIKTYLDLFIRLIIVYFMIFVFLTVFDTDNLSSIMANVGEGIVRRGLVILLIIVGLLQFVKQAPKFIGDLLGLQGAGDFMGMFKGEGWKALGSTLGTAGAAVGSGIGNARYAYKNSGMSKDKWWKKLGVGAVAGVRGLGGAAAATGRGLVAQASGKGFKDTFTNNIRTTTGNSQRRVNKGAIKRASINDRREANQRIDENIANRRQEYEASIQRLNRQRENNDIVIANLQRERNQLQVDLSTAISAGDTATANDIRDKLRTNGTKINQLSNSNLDIGRKIYSAKEDLNKDIEKLEKLRDNIPQVISPFRNAISEAFNTFTGMQSVSGSSILKASSDLASIRSTYYTGEAMKKLTEEGSKLDEKLSMGATYSEVASAYESLKNGSVSQVKVGNEIYKREDVQKLGEEFKKAEKEAAIKYINAVKAGKIKNSTIEEGFKQIYGALDGMGLDAQTKNELIKEFERDPGNFLKSLSDVSKRLETEGKRRQAYEREQKKGN